MHNWLSGRLLLGLDLVDAPEKGKRKTKDEEYLVWTYLVPQPTTLTGDDLEVLLQIFASAGFVANRADDRYVVYPANIGGDELAYQSLSAAAERLGADGGGLLLRGCGAGIALVCDPLGRLHANAIRLNGLQDEVRFAEYSIWMPFSTGDGSQHPAASLGILAALPECEDLLGATFGYCATTSDLAKLSRYWASHNELSGGQLPSEIFWFQYLCSSVLSNIDPEEYESLGYAARSRDAGGKVFQLSDIPAQGLSRLKERRPLWKSRLIPTSLC